MTLGGGRILVCAPLTHSFLTDRPNLGLRRLLEAVLGALTGAGHRVDSAHLAEDWGQKTDGLSAQEVAIRDFAWMQAADVVVAILQEPDQGDTIFSNGTFIELGWAVALRKPVIFIGDPDAFLSLLVRGLPHLLPSHSILSPRAVLECPSILTDAFESRGERGSAKVEVEVPTHQQSESAQ